MIYKTVPLENGNRAIVCQAPPRKRRCACCINFATKQCDFPVTSAKGVAIGTCDKHLCDHCAVHVGEDLDHCPDHPRGVLQPPKPAQDPQLALPL